MLLEGKFLFDVIDTDSLFSGECEKYKLLILPDSVRFDERLEKAVKKFVSCGGRVLATGESAVGYDDKFMLDLGCRYKERARSHRYTSARASTWEFSATPRM